jgi:hypothetical protein
MTIASWRDIGDNMGMSTLRYFPGFAFVLAFLPMSAMPIRAAEPSPAENYDHQLITAIDGIQADMPSITRYAERASELYVKEGLPIAIAGDTAFVSEAYGRSGGLMKLKELPVDHSNWAGVVLYALDSESLEHDLSVIASLRESGSYVIAFASASEIDKAADAGQQFDGVIDNHAGPDGGTIQDATGNWIIPVDGPADITAMWTWTAEFAAACTRLGKMPTFYLGYVNPGGREWESKIGGAKFHEETPQSVPAGELGTQYLTELRKNLQQLVANELPDIRKAAELANQTRQAGGTCYVMGIGHAIQPLYGSRPRPGYFQPLEIDPKLSHELKPNDFLLNVGYAVLPADPAFASLLESLKSSGANAVWSITTYLPDEVKRLPAGDIVIDQYWAAGDADVSLPGYPIKIIPTSGVMAETVFWMVNAEMAGEKAQNE